MIVADWNGFVHKVIVDRLFARWEAWSNSVIAPAVHNPSRFTFHVSRARFTSLLIATVLLLGLYPSAVGAPLRQAGAQMTARAGYGDNGSYLIGDWLPVYVTLSNPVGGASLRVRVEVASSGQDPSGKAGSYAREVELPSPSRKEVTLYAYSAQFANTLDISLLQGDTTIGSTSVKVQGFEQPFNTLVGVISSDSALLNVMQGETIGHSFTPLQSPGYGGMYPPTPTPAVPPGGSSAGGFAQTTVVHMGIGDIPALSAALDDLGALVIDDADTGALQPDQKQALAGWVARGGSLVVVARPGGADALAGLAGLAPVTVKGTRSLPTLQALSDLVQTPLTPTGSTLVSDATLLNADVHLIASQDGVPLVAARDLGKGQVIYMALSPGLAPLKGWDGTVPLLKRLLAERPIALSYGASIRTGNYYNSYSGGGAVFTSQGGTIFDLPGLDLPAPMLVGLFLLLYIVVIGPANFIILRRMRKAELAWITIPALIAIFAVGAYAIAYGSKGGDLVAIQANVVRTEPGLQQADTTQLLGLFSPLRRTYSLQAASDSVATEISPYGYSANLSSSAQVTGGNPTVINNVIVDTWSLKAFIAEGSVPAQSPLEATLRLGDNVIEGTLHNRGSEGLQDVALIRGGAVQRIGYMMPGASTPVKLEVSPRPFDNNSPAALLPPPAGVVAQSPGQALPYSGSGISPEQRDYNRKVELLNAGLQPLVSADNPTSMDVLAVAWGPQAPSSLTVAGQSPRYEKTNLWTSRFSVAAATGSGSKPRLRAGSVPYTVYSPGNESGWNSSVPTVLNLSPYSDIVIDLPAGTVPDSLILSYVVSGPAQSDIDWLAYNARLGKWDRLAGVNSSGSSQSDSLELPAPADYTDQAGDITIRLLAKSGTPTISFSTFDLALNDAP